MQTLEISGKQIQISDPGWISKSPNKTKKNSYVSIRINGKKIYLASSTYKYGPRTEAFYTEKKMSPDCNINLMSIPHGSDEDTRERTLPKFLAAAKQAHMKLQSNNAVLVNCNHGRSRTGSVVALYLMVYENFSADDAIQVVSLALAARNYQGGIDLAGYHGKSYGQWLREYKPLSDHVHLDENSSANSPEKPLTPSARYKRLDLVAESSSPSSSTVSEPAARPRKRAMRLFATSGEKPSFFAAPRPEPAQGPHDIELTEFSMPG